MLFLRVGMRDDKILDSNSSNEPIQEKLNNSYCMSSLGTSESFMHHPANDRSWPQAEVNLSILNVGLRESCRSNFITQGLQGAHSCYSIFSTRISGE